MRFFVTENRRVSHPVRHGGHRGLGSRETSAGAQRARARQILYGPRLQPKRTCPECEEEMQRQVASAPAAAQRIQHTCPACQAEMQRQPTDEPEEEEPLQAKEAAGHVPHVTPELEARIGALRGSGEPLPASERAFFEPRFGGDFAAVRVHTGSDAADLAQRVEARAFTLGRSVVFGQGEYRPGTEAGRRLLAHELTHFVQQDGREAAQRIQRTDWGRIGLGSKCCNSSGGSEWALVGAGEWLSLPSGCTGTWTDCDGMTCGGAFYEVRALSSATCRTPRQDDATYAPRRWTPQFASSPEARSPRFMGSQSDTPPGYTYDAR